MTDGNRISGQVGFRRDQLFFVLPQEASRVVALFERCHHATTKCVDRRRIGPVVRNQSADHRANN